MRHNFLAFVSICAILASGCQTTKPVSMNPSTSVLHDVFTCKGLTADFKWVGITDKFMPEIDRRIVVVANLAPEDRQRVVTFELTTPMKTIALTEKVEYPEEKALGIYFELDRLIQLGGEGKWRATVYSDGYPIGEATFTIGEESEGADEGDGPKYYIVDDTGDESEEATPLTNDRFSDYIQETTVDEDAPSLNLQSEPEEIGATPIQNP